MLLDSRPITSEERAELGAFLAEFNLPRLENAPVIQRLLFQDWERFRWGAQPAYIRFASLREDSRAWRQRRREQQKAADGQE
jgi:hypothetical protein